MASLFRVRKKADLLTLAKENLDGCYIWNGSKNKKGYSVVSGLGVYRVVYELLVGEIPKGYEIDHLCRNRACINPDHLEAVTKATNLLRGTSFSALNKRKKACVRGHPFDDKNTYMASGSRRKCRKCGALASAKTRRKKKWIDEEKVKAINLGGVYRIAFSEVEQVRQCGLEPKATATGEIVAA